MTRSEIENELNRRDFIKGGSFATLMTLLGGVPLFGQETSPASASPGAATSKIKVGVIGLGAWGREILETLGRIPQADIAAVCDIYPASLRRGANSAPGAIQSDDYKTILANKDIKAVIIATPTHLHKEIAIAALSAGKQVYCEAPLAHTIDDARAIAAAAKAAQHQVFQAGLQLRADPQRHFLLPFIRSGAIGSAVMTRAQWHKKRSWRAASANPDREKVLNWRLEKETSVGLIGEIGVHHIDQSGWFLDARPVSVTGFGGIRHWRDGRDVPDTVQAVIEFPNQVRMIYDATLANSFDADYEMYYGSDAAVMIREGRAWMFKEVDSPLLGWEVYARKESFHNETGIALVANASKLEGQAESGTENAVTKASIYFALETFLRNAYETSSAYDDFISIFGAGDAAALADHMSKVNRLPAAGFHEGFSATVTAIKANEAILTGQKIILQPEWYELG